MNEDTWLFDSLVIPVGANTLDNRRIEGQVRVGLPIPIIAMVEDQSRVVGIGVEARRNNGNPWISVSGEVTQPELFPELVDGKTYGVGANTINPTYITTDADGVMVMQNPTLVAITVYLTDSGRPAYEGAALKLLAPLGVAL